MAGDTTTHVLVPRLQSSHRHSRSSVEADELNFMLCGGQQQQQQLQAQCMCRLGASLKVLCRPLTLEEKIMASDHSHVERFKVSHARLLWAL